jgi:peptidoglycan/LPS O-acetylase OafA/YrhL
MSSRRIEYQPALDGLRGIAMVAIAAYHSELPWASGSFLALDSFFVLSGYLITLLLLAEWRERGRIDLVAFYSRRARRLIPAMLLALAGVAVYATAFAGGDELVRIREDVLSTMLYVNNWWQIAREHSYFDVFANPSPLRHAWSLSLEEQWYLVWAIVVLGVMTRWRSARVLAALCLAVAVASALQMAWLFEPGTDPSRVYYGTDTRAQEILLGAALACLADRGRLETLRTFWIVAGSVALVVIGGLWVTASHSAPWIYRGGFFGVSILVALLILGATQGGRNPLREIVGWGPFRWLGMISYGFYLWHWPVFLVVTRAQTGLEGLTLFGVRLFVTLLIALASYFLVERPIRRGALRAPVALGSAFACSGAIGIAIVAITWNAIPSGDAPNEAQAHWQAKAPAVPGGVPTPSAERTRVLLVGDSVAWSVGVGFIPSIEQEASVALQNRAIIGCGLGNGPIRERDGVVLQQPGSQCELWPRYWREYVEAVQPDVSVLLTGFWDVFDRQVDGEWLTYGSEAYDRYLLELLREATDALASGGAPVVLLTAPYVQPPFKAKAYESPSTERWRMDRLNEVLRRHAARSPGVHVIELGAFVCPDADCSGSDDGGPLIKQDGAHFTPRGAQIVARWLAPKLREIALAKGRTESAVGATGDLSRVEAPQNRP